MRGRLIERGVVSTATTAIAAVAAVVAVAGLIAWHATRCTHTLPTGALACRAFISTPEFLVWLMLLCAQGAVWAVAAVPVWTRASSLFADLRGAGTLTRRTVAWLSASLGAIAAAALAFAFGPRIIPERLSARTRMPAYWPLPEHALKLGLLTGCAVAVGLLAIIGMWAAAIALRSMTAAPQPAADDVTRFLELRELVNEFLLVAGTIVGLAVLATGALRNAVLALNTAPPAKPFFEFDPLYVLVYGAFFTGLLAIAYVPAYAALRDTGAWLRDSSYPLPAPTSPEFSPTLKARADLDGLLSTSITAGASFKAGVAIFAPLASSLLGLLIPKVGG